MTRRARYCADQGRSHSIRVIAMRHDSGEDPRMLLITLLAAIWILIWILVLVDIIRRPDL